MAFTKKASGTQQFLVPAGKLYIDLYIDGTLANQERYLGETDAFAVTIASESIEEYSMEAGLAELADSVLTKVTRTATMTVKQVSAENLSLFLAAETNVQTQAGGATTNEAHTVYPDRYLQLGRADANPSGVRDVSAVTITAGDAATAWAADTVTALGKLIKATAVPTYFYEATAVAGDTKTHATTEPTWPTTVGATVVDDQVTWTCVGILSPALTTDYTVDATLGRIYVVPAARVHATLGTPWAVDYTAAAREREQIKTTGVIETTAALRFISSHVRGDNRDWYMPKCIMKPGGEFPLKTEDPTYVALPFEIDITKPSDGAGGEDIAALYIDGRAVA